MWRKKTQASRGSATVRLVLTIIFLAASLWLWLNQQFVVDQISVWQYKPSAPIAQLVENSGMGDRGKFLFYASQPEIEGTQRFNQVCTRKEQHTAVLGCYNGSKIFIYDITDQRLNGIKEVTAAHEMLHAVYQRLSDSDRQKVDTLLEAEFTKLENEPTYKDRMAFYAKHEPGERDNELHSMIGTEVATISPELEQHFASYFSDRAKVVTLHEKYQAIFIKLEAESKALYAELEQLSQKVDAESNAYNVAVATLNKEIATFNTRATNGSFTTQAQFDKERASLVRRAANLDNERDTIRSLIASYEAKREQYNAIADQSKQLVNSLDSNLAPTPSVK